MHLDAIERLLAPALAVMDLGESKRTLSVLSPTHPEIVLELLKTLFEQRTSLDSIKEQLLGITFLLLIKRLRLRKHRADSFD
jgi:hypothetical protein